MKSLIFGLVLCVSITVHASQDESEFGKTKAAFDHSNIPMFPIVGQHDGYCFDKKSEETVTIWSLLDVRKEGSEIKFIPFYASVRHAKGEAPVLDTDPKVELRDYAKVHFDSDKSKLSDAKDKGNALIEEVIGQKNITLSLREGASKNLYLKVASGNKSLYCMFKPTGEKK